MFNMQLLLLKSRKHISNYSDENVTLDGVEVYLLMRNKCVKKYNNQDIDLDT